MEQNSFSVADMPDESFAIVLLEKETYKFRGVWNYHLGEEIPVDFLLKDSNSGVNEETVTKSVQPLLSEFTLFPKLPLKLRKKIWKFTITPRTISFRLPTNRSIFHGYLPMKASPHNPVMLHVCSETRQLAFTIYHFNHVYSESVDGRNSDSANNVYPCLANMWFSPEHDTLVGFLHTAQQYDLPMGVIPLNHQFRKLAIGAETLEAILNYRFAVYQSLRLCKELKEVTLILKHELLGYRDMELREESPEHVEPEMMKRWIELFAEEREGWNKIELKVASMVPKAQEI